MIIFIVFGTKNDQNTENPIYINFSNLLNFCIYFHGVVYVWKTDKYGPKWCSEAWRAQKFSLARILVKVDFWSFWTIFSTFLLWCARTGIYVCLLPTGPFYYSKWMIWYLVSSQNSYYGYSSYRNKIKQKVNYVILVHFW